MTAIKLSKDRKSVEAGAGLVWHQLYGALEPHGLVVIGGRARSIGISGLTLGGGVSFMASKYGFSMVSTANICCIVMHASLTNYRTM